MQSKLSIGFIACTLLTLLTPTSLLAITDAEYLNRYGTSRRAVTCSSESRSEPRKGRLTAAQATKHLRCLRESEGKDFNRNMIEFLDVLSLQISPPRRVTESDSLRSWTINKIDRTQPIYDIKARAVFYNCYPIQYDPNVRINQPGKNCQTYGSDTSSSLNSYGICFKDLTEKWLCHITTNGSTSKGPAPK
jgi:hypothetical protein